MTTVEGSFTTTEINRLRERLISKKYQLAEETRKLEDKRDEARKGEAKAEADALKEALDDPAFSEAVTVLSGAREAHLEAERAFRRCRRGIHGLTKTGQLRKDQRDLTQRAVNAAMTGLREVNRFGVVVPPLCRDDICHYLRGRLRRIVDSYEDGDTPAVVARLESEVSAMGSDLALMEQHRVDPDVLKRFALHVEPRACGILIRMVVDGYTPRPATLKQAPFVKLQSAGLIESIAVTDLGRDVSDWARDNMVGSSASRTGRVARAVSVAEVRRAFDPEQIQTMVAKGTALLKQVIDDGPGGHSVECGLPEDGVSYLIVPERDAVQVFLSRLGADVGRRSRCKVLRWKCPPFIPGRIVAEEV